MPIVNKPWGSYETIFEETNYLVKKIIVKPGEQLSLQCHTYRSETWTVISGEGLITIGTAKHSIYEKNSVFIPIGEIHRIKNVGEEPLILIEIQHGDYLSEDDIIRLEDDYGRK